MYTPVAEAAERFPPDAVTSSFEYVMPRWRVSNASDALLEALAVELGSPIEFEDQDGVVEHLLRHHDVREKSKPEVRPVRV